MFIGDGVMLVSCAGVCRKMEERRPGVERAWVREDADDLLAKLRTLDGRKEADSLVELFIRDVVIMLRRMGESMSPCTCVKNAEENGQELHVVRKKGRLYCIQLLQYRSLIRRGQDTRYMTCSG